MKNYSRLLLLIVFVFGVGLPRGFAGTETIEGSRKNEPGFAVKQQPDKRKPKGLVEIQGELLRFFEERGGEWDSYLLMKDSFGKEHRVFAHPVLTLVKRAGGQIHELHELAGGMRVTVLCREISGNLRASVVRIDGGYHG